ncbi:MAG TPA: protein phosphatase CheZ [Terricaulis sp.]|nr:protein phosphatase CheZ [Terricaulis sp.]HRP09576.1 protein phosphatase CheZ [Terricaulis sp.]
MSISDEAAERRALLHYVLAAQKAIADLRPAQMRLEKLPTAMSQIGLIVETTESAANQIMQAVDEIMNARVDLSPAAYRSFVEEKCLAVLEACSFQDITGQRITKVVETLLTLEDKLAALSSLLGEEAEAAPEPAPEGEAVLLNGPAMPGEGVDQDEIDKLFA